jgi:hypothetical protein
VDGGLAYGCNQSFQVASAVPGGVHFPNEVLHCEATRGGESRRRRKDRFPAGGVRNTTQGRLGRPKGRLRPEEELSQGKSTGHRMRNRRSRERQKSSASPVERRRSGPGKASSSHGGGVEAVLASLSESAQRAPRKGTHRYRREDRDRGVRRRSSRAWVRSNKPPQCEGDPLKRQVRVVKRAGLRFSVGGIPLKNTPDEESVTMSRKEAGTGAR